MWEALVAAALIASASTPDFGATWTWQGSQGNDDRTNTGNWTPAYVKL